MIRALGALVAVLFLSGCGAGAGAALGVITRLATDPPDRQQPTRPTFPAPVIDQKAKQAPIIPVYRLHEQGLYLWLIGTAQTPLSGLEASSTHDHNGVEIEHERFTPNAEIAGAVLRFLDEVEGERFFTLPPLVRVADQGTELADLVLRTVQILNSALPNDFQIRVDANPYSRTSQEAPPRGEIHVEVAPQHQWAVRLPGDSIGGAVWYTNESARIYVDTAFFNTGPSEEALFRVLAHEFLHAMGMQGHYEADPLVSQEGTLMVPHLHERPGLLGSSILFALDIWGLRQIPTPMAIGTRPVTQ